MSHTRSIKRAALVAGAAATLAAGAGVVAPSAFATTTLANGFTAKVVAHSGQTIRGVINATGYDVGIYIGPGVHGVKVLGARVTGANDHGILVQDAHDDLIKGSTVEGNGLNRHAGLEEDKAITLGGTRNIVVAGNRIEGNGDGGVGVYDDGPNSPATFAPVALHPTSSVPSSGNVVWGNSITDNLAGCGIVVAAKNPGGGVRSNLVALNLVTGYNPAGGDTTQGALGGIVVAGGSFGAVQVARTVVVHNRVTGGYIPGISIHASAPGQVMTTQLLDNVLIRNGAGAGQQPEGIELASASNSISYTQVLDDRVVDDYFGVFHVGDTGTHIAHLSTSGVTVPVAP
jgi:Right handed beta helix region